jgi:hypothetical protein
MSSKTVGALKCSFIFHVKVVYWNDKVRKKNILSVRNVESLPSNLT